MIIAHGSSTAKPASIEKEPTEPERLSCVKVAAHVVRRLTGLTNYGMVFAMLGIVPSEQDSSRGAGSNGLALSFRATARRPAASDTDALIDER
jgi:hypothetical protein